MAKISTAAGASGASTPPAVEAFAREDGTYQSPPGGVPSGTAGGDLSGTYPAPTVSQISGQALPLPVALGGTGADTAAAALTGLGLDLASSSGSATAFPDVSALYSGTPVLPGIPQPSLVLTDFQAGHGWTSSGSGTFSLNDTTSGNFIIGSQAATATSPGSSGQQCDVRNTALASFSTVGRNVRVRFRVDNMAALTELNVIMGPSTSSYWNWTVYLSGESDWIISGEWATLTLAFADAVATGTPGRTGFTFCQLQIWDGGTPCTVHWQSVELIPDGTALFPDGVVSICWDDSYSDPMTTGAWEVMDSYGYPANLFTITSQLGEAGYIALSDIQTRVDRFGWESSAHAYTDADHAATDTGLTAAQLDADARSARAWLIANGIRNTDGYAYPQGNLGVTTDNVDVISILRRYYTWARTTSSQVHETFPPADRFKLRAAALISTYAGGITPSSIETLISDGLAGTWLILTFHHITTGALTSNLQCALSDFTAIMAAISSAGVPVLTIGSVLQHYDLEYQAPVPVAGGGTGQSTAAAGFNALSPMTTLGDTIYGGASGAATRLPGNTTATRKFLTQTGTGSVSAAPALVTVAPSDLPWTSAPAANVLGPADHGLIAWNFCPYNCRASDLTAMTAGQLWVMKVPVPYACTISKVGVNMPQGFAASDATTGENYMGLWGPTGTLLSLTADLSSAVEGASAPGNLLEALVTPQAVSAGYVYVCAWANGTGTYPALLKGDAGAPVNYNLTSNAAGAASFNAAVIAAGYTNAASAGNLGTLTGLTTGIPFACVA